MLAVSVQVPQPGKSNVRETSQAPDQVLLFESASHVTCVPPPSMGRVPDAALVVCAEVVIPAPVVALGFQYSTPPNKVLSIYLPPVSVFGSQFKVEPIR